MSKIWAECWQCDECGHIWIKSWDGKTPEQCASSKCRKRSWNKNHVFVPSDPTSAADVDAASEASRIARNLPEAKPDMAALRAICAGTVAPVFPQAIPGDEGYGLTNFVAEVLICGKTWWEDGEHWECLMDAGHKETKHGMREMVRRLEQ